MPALTRECTACDEDGLDPDLAREVDWRVCDRPSWALCRFCNGTGRAPVCCDVCSSAANPTIATAIIDGTAVCFSCAREMLEEMEPA